MWRKRLITTVSTRQYSSKAFTRVHETKPIGMDSQESPKAKLEKTDIDANAKATEEKDEAPKRQKTVLEQDEELRLKLEGISGEGGGAGVEYEGGKAVGLKRGVKENMFRVI
ncbi:hypothetical protein WAI453_012725 [Rhynchosporium graminicola]|uniref:Uncharacterized protein n=1 Tax=Rhynchosporium secalis TaxID=38038 RepID=A0A1E1MLZ2_RHYSE|nr:uncharacterized protein RSE6_11029 [Rhynchosporium secalis]